MKKIFLILITLSIAIACGRKYNKVKKDANEGNAHVYGEVDGPARQLKNTYPNASQETAEKASAFRKIVEAGLAKNYQ